MEDAQAIASEWVTAMRLDHVINRIVSERNDKTVSIQDTKEVITTMIEDVLREAEGEIVDTPAVRKAIGSATAKLFKAFLEQVLHT